MAPMDEAEVKFGKSRSNRRVENAGLALLLEDARFQAVDTPTKRLIIERLPVKGEFGIQTGVVHPPQDAPVSSEPSGRTMVYSNAGRLAEPLEELARSRAQTALVVLDGRRLVVGAAGATLGRSRDCDIVLQDPNVSRKHAEIRPRGGSWVVTDLGSTNGSRINGRSVEGSEVIKPGDEIEVGSTRLTFELE